MDGVGSAAPQKLLEGLNAFCSGSIGEGQQGKGLGAGLGIWLFTTLPIPGFYPTPAGVQRCKPRTYPWVSFLGSGAPCLPFPPPQATGGFAAEVGVWGDRGAWESWGLGLVMGCPTRAS